MYKVSIIIPTYNSIKYLDDSINSVLNQSYKNIEVILVDDGSTDGTKENFHRFEAMGVKCIYQQNWGASSARNLGLEIAMGDYIQFLDADDVIHPNKIEKQLNSIINNNADMSFSLWGSFNTDIKKREDIFYVFNYNLIRTGQEVLKSFGEDNWFIPVHCWLTKKTLITKAGFWNPGITNNDDGEYFTRVLFWAQKVICENESLAYYRTSIKDSLSKFNNEKKVISALNSWRLIKSLISTCTDNRIITYPQKAFYLLFLEIVKSYPQLSKEFAHEFDKINKIYKFEHIRQFKIYSRIIALFGLYRGYKLYSILFKIRNLLKHKNNE